MSSPTTLQLLTTNKYREDLDQAPIVATLRPFPHIPTCIITLFGEFAQCSLDSISRVNKQWKSASYAVCQSLVNSYRANSYLAPIVARFTPPVGALHYVKMAERTREEVLKRARETEIIVTSPTTVKLQDLIKKIMEVIEARDFLAFFEVLYETLRLEKRPARAEITGQTAIASATLGRAWMHSTSTFSTWMLGFNSEDTQFHILPPEIGLLKNLERLYFFSTSKKKHKIEQLPHEIGHLFLLKHLTVSNSQLCEVSALRNLTTLEDLSLMDNQIRDISPLRSLLALKRLNLSSNRIPNISALYNLTALEDLSLMDNQIQDISPLCSLLALKKLNLNCNQIQNISALCNLIALEDLFLRNNQIRKIPPNLHVLKKLDLSYNQLQELSSGIPQSRTRLESEPPESSCDSSVKKRSTICTVLSTLFLRSICPGEQLWHNLRTLTELNLSNNQLRHIPPEIGEFRQLESLDLSNNQLQELPSQMHNLRALAELNVRDNPLRNLEIINQKKLTTNILRHNKNMQKTLDLLTKE